MYYLFFKANSDEAAIKDFYYINSYNDLYQAVNDAVNNHMKLYSVDISVKMFGKRIDDSAAALTNHYYYLAYVNNKCMRKNFNKNLVYDYYKQVKKSNSSIDARVDICNTHHYLINNNLCKEVSADDLKNAFHKLNENIDADKTNNFENLCTEYEKR